METAKLARLALSPYSVLGNWVDLSWTISLNSVTKSATETVGVMTVRN